MKKPIFISYRVTDTAGHAGRLADGLKALFPDQVFLDVDVLKSGMTWAPEIEENVRSCDVFIVVIGDGWLRAQDLESGIRRLDQPEDWVRREIEIALGRNPRPLILPVLVGGGTLPKTAHLPPSIAGLSEFQHHIIQSTDYQRGIDRLVERFPQDVQATSIRAKPSQRAGDDRDARVGAMVLDYSDFLCNRLDSFVGRATELSVLNSLIQAKRLTGGYITISGEAGQGKSSIIAKLIELFSPERPIVHIIPFNPGPDHQVSLLRNILAQFVIKYDLPDIFVTSETRPILRNHFFKVLQDTAGRAAKETIFIDGLDQIQEELNGERDLTFLPQSIPPGVVCVVGTRPNDTLRPLELLTPHAEYKLPVLSEADFRLVLQRRGVSLDADVIRKLYVAMQAHALYLDLAAKELAFAANTDSSALFSRLTANPESVFSLSIDRLKLQQDRWRRIVKPILGVLLVAQEPLSDTALHRILREDGQDVREGLLKLGGLVSYDSHRHYQLFHLKFYDYLRAEKHEGHTQAVFDSDDQRRWHSRVAEWCGPIGVLPKGEPGRTSDEPGEQERRSYALDYRPAHLYLARDWVSLFKCLDSDEYRDVKLRHDPSARGYIRDLEFGCLALAGESYSIAERAAHISKLWRYSLTRMTLASRVKEYPEVLFTLLVLRGRHRDALELIESLPGPEAQSRALFRVGEALAFSRTQHDRIVPILTRARELALEIGDLWSQAEVLLSIVGVLAVAGYWDDAIKASYDIGNYKDRLVGLGKVLGALACAHEEARFHNLLADASRLAKLTGLRWAAEGSYRQMGSLLRNPALGSEVLAGIQSGSYEPIIAKAMFSFATEAVLDLASDRLRKSCSDSWLDLYVCIARYVLTHPGQLASRVSRELVLLTDDIDGGIPFLLLLVFAGQRSAAESRVSALLTKATFSSDSFERAEALLLLHEDLADLRELSPSANYNDVLDAALTIARTIGRHAERTEMLRRIANGFVKFGDADQGVRIYIESGGGPLQLYEEVGLHQKVKELEEKGHEHVKVLSLKVSDQYFSEAIGSGNWGEAEELIESLQTPPKELEEVDASPERRRLGGFAGSERLNDLHSLKDKYNAAVHSCAERMSTLSRAMFAAGERRRASAILSDARVYANRVRVPERRIAMLEIVFQAAAETGDEAMVFSLSSEMVPMSREASTSVSEHAAMIGRLIAGLVRTGQRWAAGKLIETELDPGRNESASPAERRFVMRTLARSLWRTGDTNRCTELIHRQWLAASHQNELLALLPLASTIICSDSKQRADVLASLVNPAAIAFEKSSERPAV